MNLQNKTVFITGASRGIGRAMALRFARDGANVAIAAKTSEPHPKLPGTIHTVAAEVEAAGGTALPLLVDVRHEDVVADAMRQTAEKFGGIDALVNNAGAIFLAGTTSTPMKRVDLMFGVNVRATYAASQAAIPYLKNSDNGHILNLSPPMDMSPRWLESHVAYTISKYGMSMCTLGMAGELRSHGIAVNSLWPRTIIATDALRMVGGTALYNQARTPEIMADAAHAILSSPSAELTGNLLIDEVMLANAGITDLDHYSVVPGADLMTDLFVTEEE